MFAQYDHKYLLPAEQILSNAALKSFHALKSANCLEKSIEISTVPTPHRLPGVASQYVGNGITGLAESLVR